MKNEIFSRRATNTMANYIGQAVPLHLTAGLKHPSNLNCTENWMSPPGGQNRVWLCVSIGT